MRLRETFRIQIILALVLGAVFVTSAAQAWTLKTLHSFCAKANCADGKAPMAPLLAGPSGTLYGTASQGGRSGQGAIFALTPTSGKWHYDTLYSFCRKTGCKDGENPQGSLLMDTAGNLYGTTSGSTDFQPPNGTVFKLVQNGSRWRLDTLRNFDRGGGHSPRNPMGELAYAGKNSGVPYDGTSPLYGTSSWGGRCSGGTVYGVAPTSTGEWDVEKLKSFGSNCSVDYNPWFGVYLAASGDIFGTTFAGGVGTLYRLSFDGKRWRDTVLCTFKGNGLCGNGGIPAGPLIADASGNLIGVTAGGGAHNGGIVYRVAPDGSQFTVLYDFCALDACRDGATPGYGVTADAAGNLYGTTTSGGDQNQGVIFKLSPNGDEWEETVLYSFCARAGCRDGASPQQAGVTLGAEGNLYGVTRLGGAFGGGTVFQLSP